MVISNSKQYSGFFRFPRKRGVKLLSIISKPDVIFLIDRYKISHQINLARVFTCAYIGLDGDTVFALATGQRRANVSTVGAYAADVLAQAGMNTVQAAKPAGGPAAAGNT